LNVAASQALITTGAYEIALVYEEKRKLLSKGTNHVITFKLLTYILNATARPRKQLMKKDQKE
jgi:hypothetical protein